MKILNILHTTGKHSRPGKQFQYFFYPIWINKSLSHESASASIIWGDNNPFPWAPLYPLSWSRQYNRTQLVLYNMTSQPIVQLYLAA